MSIGSQQFETASPISPYEDAATLWQAVRLHAAAPAAHGSSAEPSIMEDDVSFVTVLNEAPPRTLHSHAITRSSPLSSSIRAMLESHEFGRRYDTLPVNVAAIEDRLPGLGCPTGAVRFLASDHSLDELSFSVDCLLQHRKRLLTPTIDRTRARRNVLVLGAGPGGLMTAIQLRLRDHRVIVCEPREVYTRNRFIGIYKEVAHCMAVLGMPESMTYDFTHYRGKRGVMLADIQTFLHGIALKLGVVIYTGAVARDVSAQAVRSGTIELQRSTEATAGRQGSWSLGMTRWHYDTVARVRSGVAIRFDTIIEASGGRSGLREMLVGSENVISLRSQGRAAAQRDPSLNSFFDDPEDHCAQFVESDFCCPGGLREPFARALLHGDDAEVPDELPGLVSNIDASIIRKPIQKVGNIPGIAARIGDKELNIPADWVVVECRLSDHTVARYQIEGPLPQTFHFGGKRVPTSDYIKRLNPLSLLLRILYAMGVPFDAIDRRQLVEFYGAENSQGDASDIVAVWTGNFKSLRLGGELPRWCGRAPGTDAIEYAIVGEALQNAWYRFGVGVDDTVAAASRYAELIELPSEARLAEARRFEHVMTARSVQVLYHLYAIARRTEQTIVSPLLAECYMDEQQAADLTEARLRHEARQGAEMLAAERDVGSGGSDPLLEAALGYRRELCCRRFLNLLTSASGDPELRKRRMQPMLMRSPGWRRRAVDTLSGALSPRHREMLMPLVEELPSQSDGVNGRQRQERIIELALGRYAWASPWLRACALRALDLSTPGAVAVVERAASDPDSLVAETAAALSATSGGKAPFAADSLGAGANAVVNRAPCVTVDKVAILRKVSLFNIIADEDLAKIAALLTERWAASHERIIEQGALGDCLYIIASGRVRIHEGERTLTFLGPQHFFGELSLLDAEPRSASVTAVEPTHLFRFDQTDFYALVGEQPEILPAINRRLCQMIRIALRSEFGPQEQHLVRE